MDRELDMTGKTCPIPLIETLKILETMKQGESIKVTVDNETAVRNLSKMAAENHLECSAEKISNSSYTVLLTVTGTSRIPPADGIACSSVCKTVVVLSSDRMGEGDGKLGAILMKGFIYALTGLKSLPSTVILYNGGARLSVFGSDSLEDLKLLESQGVEILTCGTCLNHYGLTGALGVGSITNMYVIAEKLAEADKVIKP
jgi:selenium metabolism protein YedF